VETVVGPGEVVDVIVEEARRRAADLVIIATRGRAMLGRGAGGSVAERLLERLPVPILLVRAWHDEAASPQFVPGARIVVPLDGSLLAEEALPIARAFVEALGGELILMHVTRRAPPWVRDDAGAVTGAAMRDYLDRLARDLATEGLRNRVEVATGDVVREIVAAIHRHDAAVVVIATHGQTGLAHMPIGSVARAVLWDACVPVALIRPTVMLPAGTLGAAGYASSPQP
jgi:nucleotide-binding universal stress UspA family protein